MKTKTSPKGIAALISHEGIVPAPYLDSKGIWTWGVGHTAAAGAPLPSKMVKGMPKDLNPVITEVLTVFAADLVSYEDAVSKAVKVPLEQHEFDALVSFHFNTGAIARAEVTRLLNLGDRKGAAKAFLNWKTPAEIIERRKDEQNLFLTGEYPKDKLNVWGVNSLNKPVFRPVKSLTPSEVLGIMSQHWSDVTVPKVEEHEDSGAPETDQDTGLILIAKGSKGGAVAKAQDLLRKAGYKLVTDGHFGLKTHNAVVDFQKKNGLSPDGKVGNKTWAKLTALKGVS